MANLLVVPELQVVYCHKAGCTEAECQASQDNDATHHRTPCYDAKHHPLGNLYIQLLCCLLSDHRALALLGAADIVGLLHKDSYQGSVD